ncbi:MAG: DNA-binding protein [Gammaproteobacteria bacterium]|nr:MAG: DNA-binding protein [Gammaproteobacteria bacterium]
MKTVIETPTFSKLADKIWTEDERLDFISFISVNSKAGDVIPNAEGARKVRWAIKGSGKRGGTRVIYFNYSEQGVIELIYIYKKGTQENIKANDIKKVNRK